MSAVERENPFEAFIVEHIPESVLEIIDAVHDGGQTPAEQAMEHLHDANSHQAEMIAALSAGDVDAGMVHLAEAEASMQSSVEAVHPTPHFGDDA